MLGYIGTEYFCFDIVTFVSMVILSSERDISIVHMCLHVHMHVILSDACVKKPCGREIHVRNTTQVLM